MNGAQESTIDEKVAVFEDAGNGPEATAEYRASLEQTAAQEAEEAAPRPTDQSGQFAQAVTVLRSGSGVEDKFAIIADVFDLLAENW